MPQMNCIKSYVIKYILDTLNTLVLLFDKIFNIVMYNMIDND